MKPARLPFYKVLNPCTDLFVTIAWTGERLSITGVLKPNGRGDAESCGQILDELKPARIAGTWNATMVERLREIWRRWHLNDMRAGAPDQEQALREALGYQPNSRNSYYDWACAKLRELGIYESQSGALIKVHGKGERVARGYKYGEGWVYEEVPDQILEELAALPDSARSLPNVWRDHKVEAEIVAKRQEAQSRKG